MPHTAADSNLLFGVLALQADLLDAQRFAEACAAWAGRKNAHLADLLLERGWITPQDKATIERLVELKVQKHSGDVRASLAAVVGPAVHDVLSRVDDPAIQQSLVGLPPHGLQQRGDHVLLGTVAYQPGTRDRYTLTRLHAKGGIGAVWLAHDTALGREVALKELRVEKKDQPQLWARFVEEARITGQLQHPSIVPVYELVRPGNVDSGGMPFYTMRFVRGRTFREAILAYHEKRAGGSAGPLDLRELLGAFVSVCNAVAYAHSRGVLHRDLKGQNVVLGDFGEVMLLDWGLAKVVGQPGAAISTGAATYTGSTVPPISADSEPSRGETLQGQVLGTPGYMAPEQAEGRLEQIDARTDVYGLGAMLYEVLTKQPPFSGSDTLEIVQKVIHEAPVRPRALVPTVPRALEAICLQALAKDPARALCQRDGAGRRHPALARGRAGDGLPRAADGAGTALDGAASTVDERGRRDGGGGAGGTGGGDSAPLGRQSADRRRPGIGRPAQARGAGAARSRQGELPAGARCGGRILHEGQRRSALEGKGSGGARKELLQTAAKFHERFVERAGGDPHQQADLGRAYVRLWRLTGSTGNRERALELFRQSLAIFQELNTAEPESAEYRDELARTYSYLGNWIQSTTKHADSAEYLHKAEALWLKLTQEFPNEPKYARPLGETYCDLAEIVRRTGQREAGLRWFARRHRDARIGVPPG